MTVPRQEEHNNMCLAIEKMKEKGRREERKKAQKVLNKALEEEREKSSKALEALEERAGEIIDGTQ